MHVSAYSVIRQRAAADRRTPPPPPPHADGQRPVDRRIPGVSLGQKCVRVDASRS